MKKKKKKVLRAVHFCAVPTQVCNLNNACCISSDDRCLLLSSRSRSYGLECLCSLCSAVLHCFRDLLLCGDFETNPGPRAISTRSGSNQNVTREEGAGPDAQILHRTNESSVPSVAEMFAKLLAGQKRLSTDFMLLQQSVDSRFLALEYGVNALELALLNECFTSAKLSTFSI